jgi:hypothetical protein
MASYAYTFTSGDTVTPTKLNNARTVSNIVNADVSNSAAIAGTKIAPNFGSQNIQTTGELRILQSAQVFINRSSNNTTSGQMLMQKSRGTLSFPSAVQSGDTCGALICSGHDGSGFVEAANIFAQVDGAVGSNSVPGRIVFQTASSGDAPSERMRIDSAGNVGIGTTSPDAAATLTLTSTTKGFLPPRMTTAQRNAISTPPAGLIIYNTSTNKLNVRTASSWEAVTSA